MYDNNDKHWLDVYHTRLKNLKQTKSRLYEYGFKETLDLILIDYEIRKNKMKINYMI
jgi:hypothetical protein